MADSSIEWTTKTWNPVIGCEIVSAGCKNCYAMKMAKRLEAMGQANYTGLTKTVNGRAVWTNTVRCLPEKLEEPLRWKKPARVFVNSMSDLFHERVAFEFVDFVFATMALAPQHTFQILTKRPERMREYLNDMGVVRRICEKAYLQHRSFHRGDAPEFSTSDTRAFRRREKAWWDHVGELTAWTVLGSIAAQRFERNEPNLSHPSWVKWPLPNVWLGVSVEDQKTADERIPLLLQTPAAVRFVSYEPALGPVDFQRLAVVDRGPYEAASGIDALNGAKWWCSDQGEYGEDCERLDWVIVGGESGPGARPAHPDWFRSVRDQCQAAGVAFFFKQWGEFGPVDKHALVRVAGEDIVGYARLGKKAAGRILDGRTWDEFPEARKAVAA